MKKIKVLDLDYELITNHKNSFDKDSFLELVTEYFVDYDYIVGDYSYSKLRLKGFCDEKNSMCNEINNFKNLDDYIKNNCAYGCGYFVLKKVNK